MKIKTKYSIGDEVWYTVSYAKPIVEACPTCGGKGEITLDRTFTCPSCYGKKHHTIYEPKKYHVNNIPYTIGSVRLDIRPDKYEETYMCKETGVGSGSVYCVEDLFPTKKEAQIECDIRNKEF